MIELVLKPRIERLNALIRECAAGRLKFSGPGSLCEQVSSMGYTINGLYEMVRVAEGDKDVERGR